jgi:hypothetical protein
MVQEFGMFFVNLPDPVHHFKANSAIQKFDGTAKFSNQVIRKTLQIRCQQCNRFSRICGAGLIMPESNTDMPG